jgi:hypothetical protein
MRIVYDDNQQPELCKLYKEFIDNLNPKEFLRFSYGSERINDSAVKNALQCFLKEHNFLIGDTVTHAHGIGNNCQYPVYYTGNPEELQQVAYINLNHGMFGEMYTSLDDYNQKLISRAYEISKWGVK